MMAVKNTNISYTAQLSSVVQAALPHHSQSGASTTTNKVTSSTHEDNSHVNGGPSVEQGDIEEPSVEDGNIEEPSVEQGDIEEPSTSANGSQGKSPSNDLTRCSARLRQRQNCRNVIYVVKLTS